MNKVKIKFEYCYGIASLETEFDFSSKNVFAIYAPNGTMKTSFAKSFKDLSKENKPQDLVFQDRKTTYIVQDENKQNIPAEEIFVIGIDYRNCFN
jgi:ABC-type molybdate transport system ATPase subunit